MNLLHDFTSYILGRHLFQKEDLLILAVSGGADSVALCELCRMAGLEFQIAHCNFQLRGAESLRDEEFVKSVAEKFRVPFHLKRFDTEEYSREKRCSIQVAARELRYQWFDQLLDEFNGEQKVYLLTAHHANDSIETLLMNFFKGTGIKGLQGIPHKNGAYARPLLFAFKNDLLEFLNVRRLSFVEDSSNLSGHYTRNYFRLDILPALKKVYPQVEENLKHNLDRFHEVEILYDQAIERAKKNLLEYKGSEMHIPVLKLLKTKPLKTILYEIVKDYQFLPDQLDDIISLLHAETGKYIASPTYRIIRNRNWLIVAPRSHRERLHILIEEDDDEITFEAGKLQIRRRNWKTGDAVSSANTIALMDEKTLDFPLLLRRWKQGDYFYPIGMKKKKKKIGRFLSDLKLTTTEKENTWVLESRKRIGWVIGRRLDERFKITGKTTSVLEVKFDHA